MSDNPMAFPAVPGFDQALLGKFVERIDAGSWAANQCWPWSGHVTDRGYGVFAPTKKGQFRAHRFALHAYLGREPVGMVLHNCHNRRCVNPLHLSEGTHKENMAQMADRRRAARGPRHPKAKLSTAKAVAMTLLNKSGDYSTRELAVMFGMHQSTVAAIVIGRLWPDAYAIADALLAARKAPAA